ncbi:MAG: hypothetical protein IPK70_16890 [Flavobacteriales bacterium]|jgi:hypothetical protein|nr:hypothetical protein [Flavobacteriales bacterium]
MKLFNRVRQRLLGDGQLKRYLLYAFGEIILVVIGILIALQLNTWKADQRDRASEKVHLENLREDLRLQMEVIRTQMVHDSTMILQADTAMTFFSGGMSLGDLERRLYGSTKLGWRKTFVASDATFKVLLSTGGMNLIGSPQLRTELMRYHQQLDYTTQVLNTNNRLIDELFSLNASNATPSFSMDAGGNIENGAALTGQERYRLHELIEQRRDLSKIALAVCDKQRNATERMIARLNKAITH